MLETRLEKVMRKKGIVHKREIFRLILDSPLF